MGLDMYLFKVKDGKQTQLAYWRKHHDLHGWMEIRWESKGLKCGDEDFNLRPFELTSKDLTALKKAVKTGSLPKTSGFFFGNYPPDDESRENDLRIIQDARDAMKEGYTIVYNSWW